MQIELLVKQTLGVADFTLNYEPPEPSYKRQQGFHDGSSCGVIVAENGLSLLRGDTDWISKGQYPDGCAELRKKHVRDVNNEQFSTYANNKRRVFANQDIKQHTYPVSIDVIYQAMIDAVQQLPLETAFKLTHAFYQLSQALAYGVNGENIFAEVAKLIQQNAETFTNIPLNKGATNLIDFFFIRDSDGYKYTYEAVDLLTAIARRGVSFSNQDQDKHTQTLRTHFLDTGCLHGTLISEHDSNIIFQSHDIHSITQLRAILIEETCDEVSALGQNLDQDDRQKLNHMLFSTDMPNQEDVSSGLYKFVLPKDAYDMVIKAIQKVNDAAARIQAQTETTTTPESKHQGVAGVMGRHGFFNTPQPFKLVVVEQKESDESTVTQQQSQDESPATFSK